MSNPAKYQLDLLQFSEAFRKANDLKLKGQLSALNSNLGDPATTPTAQIQQKTSESTGAAIYGPPRPENI